MKPFKLYSLLLLVASSLTAVSSFADTFNFSYTFANGLHNSKGSITGIQVGDSTTGYVTNVDLVSLYVDNVQVGGSLFSHSYSSGWQPDGSAIVSFDLSQNNFLFIDVDVTNSANNNKWHYYFELLTPSASAYNQAYIFDQGNNYGEIPAAGKWSLTNQISSVPDTGSTLALLGAALFSLGALRRRFAA